MKWEPGRIEAVGYDANGKEVARSAHRTAGNPAAVRMKVIAGPGGLRADGSDLVLIETEVLDKDSRRCPLAQNLIHYRIDGPAVWRGGIWEEDVKRYANAKELPVLNGIHRVIVRSTVQPGTIKVTAESDGIKPATVEMRVQDVGLKNGVTPALPAVFAVAITGEPVYGPDLGPAPSPPPGAFASEKLGVSVTGEIIHDLSTAFPHGATLVKGAKNGARIYKDRPWTFAGLPGCLAGADYLQVANDDTTASAGEGVVFKIGAAGKVYIAYDDGNSNFPVLGSPGGFKKTKDKILIGGRPHTIYRSGQMNGGELTYLGTNSWTEQPRPGLNNYVVFIKAEIDPPGRAP